MSKTTEKYLNKLMSTICESSILGFTVPLKGRRYTVLFILDVQTLHATDNKYSAKFHEFSVRWQAAEVRTHANPNRGGLAPCLVLMLASFIKIINQSIPISL